MLRFSKVCTWYCLGGGVAYSMDGKLVSALMLFASAAMWFALNRFLKRKQECMK